MTPVISKKYFCPPPPGVADPDTLSTKLKSAPPEFATHPTCDNFKIPTEAGVDSVYEVPVIPATLHVPVAFIVTPEDLVRPMKVLAAATMPCC